MKYHKCPESPLPIEADMGPDFILVNISVDFVDPIFATDVELTVAGSDRTNKPVQHVQHIFIKIETWLTKEKPFGYAPTGGGLIVFILLILFLMGRI